MAKEFMGNRNGRICLAYGVDFDEGDTLKYEAVVRDGEISGNVASQEELDDAIRRMLRGYATDRIEVALKKFSNGKVRGLCPKSYPRTPLTIELLNTINLCLGGQSGVELCQLPFEGALTDQPNLFVEGYTIFVQEHTSYMRKLRAQENNVQAR